MLNHNTQKIEKSCREVIKSLKNQISWKWDERFETVLAQFSVEEKDKVHKILEQHLGNIWMDKNKNEAPETIKPIIEYFGGLEPNQKLYTSTLDENNLILCAWWPWGNGQTISIRVGVFYAESMNDEEYKSLMQMLRTWFDV
jgi:hypothetical protein